MKTKRSEDPMATFPPSENAGFPNENPYAPPSASLIGGEPLHTDDELSEAEAIRRKFLSHEASVKSVGSLHYIAAVFTAFVAIAGIVQIATGGGGNREAVPVLVGVDLFYFAVTALHVALGIGLNRLQVWARWTDVVLNSIGLAFMLLASIVGAVFATRMGMGALLPVLIFYGFVGLISVYILYLLLSRKSSVVFSPDYRAIIERTPHIKYKTSLLVKILLVVLVSIILMAIFAAIFAPRR
jgi:hypothetical protein